MDQLHTVIVNPHVDMMSKTYSWLSPISVVTRNGREIPLVNENGVEDFDYSVRLAEKVAATLNCDVYWNEPEVPLTVKPHERGFVITTQEQETGVWGEDTPFTSFGRSR